VELRHVGSVYLDRDPSPLLRAMAAANSTESARFRLTFVGNVGQPERQHIETAAEQCGVQRDISYTGRLPRPEALRAQAEADVLVLLPQDSDMAIPAKLFEYSGAAAFVLVMAEPDSATAELLAGRDAYVVPPQDVEQLRAALVDIRRRLQAGERPRPLNHDGFFDRSRQAEVLLRHLRSAGLLTSAV
jgi:glycosyltransferase involved in cell wall biosynthesis